VSLKRKKDRGNDHHAKIIGAEIGKQAMVSIPFCGGCSEVMYIDSRQILLNDLHRHIITLAKTISSQLEFDAMMLELDTVLVHPDCLAHAREVLATIEKGDQPAQADRVWAAAYFINVWLSRSNAGTKSEFRQPLASRRTTTGGSSIRRWRSAVDGLQYWRQVIYGRCEFECLEWRHWMVKVRDELNHAIYADPPWFDSGGEYAHAFTEQDHRDLAECLRKFEQCRVVIRHSDHPVYRELYGDWTWVPVVGRTQGNNPISEMLIINGPSYTSR
jgi:site-specific DNA-adenine methylase